jgi:hypothetical protein
MTQLGGVAEAPRVRETPTAQAEALVLLVARQIGCWIVARPVELEASGW